eukprot:2063313-Prymnesium_polylepis.1
MVCLPEAVAMDKSGCELAGGGGFAFGRHTHTIRSSPSVTLPVVLQYSAGGVHVLTLFTPTSEH